MCIKLWNTLKIFESPLKPWLQVSALREATKAAGQAVRDLGAWHCEEKMGAGWELGPGKQWLGELHT